MVDLFSESIGIGEKDYGNLIVAGIRVYALGVVAKYAEKRLFNRSQEIRISIANRDQS